jgi:hypothetical protein
MPKNKEIAPLPMAVSHTKEELMVMFKDLVDLVEAELAAPEQGLSPQDLTTPGVATALDIDNRSVDALEKRENFKQLLDDHDIEEQRIRRAVARAEMAARRIGARRKLLLQSVQTYMEQRSILEIPTLMGYFKLGNQPDKLIIDDEKQIPQEFFDQEAVIVTTLNKDRLTAALDAGKEVSGAHLETKRKNLLVR